ncbi:heterokaryon incompatibility protein-domain-containing protein [Xylariales sp. AK1849]|nr:heterokaryon incompatibility protein-domain-containing protein [Xylariales sp. AK1849]
MAANQSRRLIALESTQKPVPVDTPATFRYQQLSEGIDCTRLLTIRPSENEHAPVVCELVNVEFRDKPEYEALSYTWGDPSDESSIIINGCEFKVRQNLFDALRYLRTQARKLPIWIDALSINQEDMAERNRQLRIMHHIYFRASTVVVWLGAEYTKYKKLFGALRTGRTPSAVTTPDDTTASVILPEDEISDVEKTGEERELVMALSENGYWQRLWIIQEIGQAVHIVVGFGSSQPMEWVEFMHLMNMHNVGNDGPVRLDNLRRNVDKGAHTFHRLLYDHRHAVCAEQRDKIYGLVGLAADGNGFPMGYNKPLIEVWTDVMHFVNDRQLVEDSELIRFGALVKSLVMGTDCSPLQQVLRPGLSNDTSNPTSETRPRSVFGMQGYILGQVVHVGACVTSIIGQLSTVDDWNEKVQVNFRDDVEWAQRENIMLQRAILRPPTSRTCFNHVSDVRWQTIYGMFNTARTVEGLSTYQPKHPARLEFEEDSKALAMDVVSTEPRLYHMRTHGSHDIPWRMGIASYKTEPGDLIVLIRNTRQALVVGYSKIDPSDPTKLASLQIIGMAWVTEDVATKNSDHRQRMDTFRDGSGLRVQMDVETIFVLITQHDGVLTIAN